LSHGNEKDEPIADRDETHAFARQRRRGLVSIAAGLIGGAGLIWLGMHRDAFGLVVAGVVVMVPAVLKGAADMNTCPHCGEGTEIPEDASGSWNHCYSCGARIR
jgi:hypothetical protein